MNHLACCPAPACARVPTPEAQAAIARLKIAAARHSRLLVALYLSGRESRYATMDLAAAR